MDENPQNDLQDVTPDPVVTDDSDEVHVIEESDEVDQEMANLRKELADKDEQIATLSRIKREAKKAVREAKSDSKKTNKQSDELDYGQKAYLNTKGIDEADHDFIQDQLSESKMDLKELLNNGYFKAKLQENVDARVVSDATPSGTRGAKEPASSKTDFWIDKGELPPNTPENRTLRADVVNQRMANEKNRSSFTEIPIIDG